MQGIIGLIETRNLVHVRRADQSAVEPIRPGMIRTLNRRHDRRLFFQARSAVPADIVKTVICQTLSRITIEDSQPLLDLRFGPRNSRPHLAICFDARPAAIVWKKSPFVPSRKCPAKRNISAATFSRDLPKRSRLLRKAIFEAVGESMDPHRLTSAGPHRLNMKYKLSLEIPRQIALSVRELQNVPFCLVD